MQTNNKTAIIRNWKERWNNYRDNKSAQKVEIVTGAYPDSKQYQSPSYETSNKMTENDLIKYALKHKIIY